jgi:RHS repeat-associated protein
VLDLDGNGDKTEATPLDLDRFARFQGTGPVVDMGAYEYAVRDCNSNQTADHVDIALGTSDDCNANAVPDECELSAGTATDCDVNGTLDECDLMIGDALDCNENGLPDSCDITAGTSQDGNQNGTPDECEEIPLPYRVEYGYDYMGRKIRGQTFDWDPVGEEWDGPVQDTKYVYNGWTIIEELDGNDSDAVTRQYTWGLDLAAQAGSVNSLEQAGGIGGLLAAYDTAGTTSTADDRTFLYLYDANGNVGQLVETTTGQRYGTVQAHYEYTPYGQVLIEPDLYDQPYRFSTKSFDSRTGLGYWGYRHYSLKLGRWITRDSVWESGVRLLRKNDMNHLRVIGVPKVKIERMLNQLEYVCDSPVNFVDLLGLCRTGDRCFDVTGFSVMPGYSVPPNAKAAVILLIAGAELATCWDAAQPIHEDLPIPSVIVPGPSPGPGETLSGFVEFLASLRKNGPFSVWYQYECGECKCGWPCWLGITDPDWARTYNSGWVRCGAAVEPMPPGQILPGGETALPELAEKCREEAWRVAKQACRKAGKRLYWCPEA